MQHIANQQIYYVMRLYLINRQLNQSIRNITESAMLKRKKTSNKQNSKNKKIPQLTIPSNYHTQQVRIPTTSSMDLKSFNRTIDLKNNATLHTKKSISRKSTIQSMKPNVALNSPNFSRLLRDFKELKLIHENSSKSPKSCKSKSGKKIKTNKTSFRTLQNRTLTVKNSTLRLQKTLKKLNLTDLFKEELSQLPIASISQGLNNNQEIKIIECDNEESINMLQLRQFCNTAAISQKRPYQFSTRNPNFFKENKAALKIQQAWKRYRTKRIIERYMSYMKSRLSQRFEHDQQKFLSECEQQQINIFSSDLYNQNLNEIEVRQISELSNKINQKDPSYQEQIETIKHDQLNKWDQIIAIIRKADKNNPNDIQKLITTISQKSQLNKKKLQQCRSARSKPYERIQECDLKLSVPIIQQKNQQIEPPNIEIARKGLRIPIYKSPKSQNSVQEHQEYNSRKYVNCLDCDVFPYQSQIVSGSSQLNFQKIIHKSTISKQKQQELLNKLNNQPFPSNLGSNKLYSSNSLICLNPKKQRQTSNLSNSRTLLNKATSQKVLKYSLQGCISEQHVQKDINIHDLERQYLESGEIIIEGNDPGKHLATDRSDQGQLEVRIDNQFLQFNQNDKLKQDEIRQQKNHPIFERSNQSFDVYHDIKQGQQLSFFKMHTIQNQESRQQQQQNAGQIELEIVQGKDQQYAIDKQQNIHDISILIFNSLVLQVLKDISKSDILASSLKSYSKIVRPKIKRSQNGVRKKGFPTDKKEIQTFLDCIINYVKHYQAKVFKNLQIPTGPSALEMLRYMHDSSHQQLLQDEGCNEDDQANLMVIPNRVFQLFWQLKEKSIVVEVPANFNQNNLILFKQNFDYLKNFNKIFYRSLFDAFNQCLDYSRNYGQFGKPFPWKRSYMFSHSITDTKIEFRIFSARKRMMDLATTYCGLIIQKQDMGQIGGNEQYIAQVQQDRLSRMLANDLMDCQGKWTFYDDEQAQILIELSGIIYRQIMKQSFEQIFLLN